jgi:hypothetical protein
MFARGEQSQFKSVLLNSLFSASEEERKTTQQTNLPNTPTSAGYKQLSQKLGEPLKTGKQEPSECGELPYLHEDPGVCYTIGFEKFFGINHTVGNNNLVDPGSSCIIFFD